MMEQAIHELRGEPVRPDFEPELRLGIPAYIPDASCPTRTSDWCSIGGWRARIHPPISKRCARRCAIASDRSPTLVENLIAAMNIRRQMRDLMIVSAILKDDQLEIKFHPDAPVEPDKLTALANANRTTMKLTPSFQVITRLSPGEYEQTYAQIDGVLQALAACEKLENRPAANAGVMAN